MNENANMGKLLNMVDAPSRATDNLKIRRAYRKLILKRLKQARKSGKYDKFIIKALKPY